MRTFVQAVLILAAATAPAKIAAQSFTAPGSSNQLAIEQADAIVAADVTLPSDRVSDALLTSITARLSSNFDLKPTTILPRVKHASVVTMTRRRYRTLLGADGPDVSPTGSGLTTVAIYDRTEATIYLPLEWSGNDPAELSVLVHEMVHHLQHVARTTFECPQAREQLAYTAQQRWLGLFGRTLEGDFQIDPSTLLVTTRCMH